MNNDRRKTLNLIYSSLEELKAQLEDTLNEEQEAYDNMPESLQNSERGEISVEAIINMEYAISDIENAMDNIEQAKGE